MLDALSLLIPKEMNRQEYEEYGYWGFKSLNYFMYQSAWTSYSFTSSYEEDGGVAKRAAAIFLVNQFMSANVKHLKKDKKFNIIDYSPLQSI